MQQRILVDLSYDLLEYLREIAQHFKFKLLIILIIFIFYYSFFLLNINQIKLF